MSFSSSVYLIFDVIIRIFICLIFVHLLCWSWTNNVVMSWALSCVRIARIEGSRLSSRATNSTFDDFQFDSLSDFNFNIKLDVRPGRA